MYILDSSGFLLHSINFQFDVGGWAAARLDLPSTAPSWAYPILAFIRWSYAVRCAVPALLRTETGCSGYDAGLGGKSINPPLTQPPVEEVLSNPMANILPCGNKGSVTFN